MMPSRLFSILLGLVLNLPSTFSQFQPINIRLPLFKLLLLLLSVVYGKRAIAGEQVRLDSLITIANHQQDTQAVLACHMIGKELESQHIDSAYSYLIRGAELSDRLDYQKGKLLIWRSLGSVEARRGNYAESKNWTNKGLSMIEAENLPIINRVDYLINLGVADYFKGNIGTALGPHIEAVEICRQHCFDEKRAKLLNNIGIFYRQLKRYDEALRIYQEGIELRLNLKDTAGVANIYHNMAAAYSFTGDHENALESAEKSRKLYEILGRESDLILCELSMGTALQRLGRIQEAKSFLVKLDQTPSLQLPPHHRCLLGLSLAELALDEGNPLTANKQLDKIQTQLFESDFKDFQIKWFQFKARTSEGMGNLRLANQYLHQFIEANAEKSEAESTQLRKEMETKYLSQEKDHQIDLLSTERELAAVQLKVARQRNIGLLVGFILLTLFSGLMVRLYQKIKKQNRLIKSADEEKTTLLKEIHHRVKNNLQVISALLELQSMYIQDKGAKEALLSGQNRVASMALIHKDLYQHDNLKGVNIRDYIAKLVDNLNESYQLPNHQISIEQNIADLHLDVDTMIPLGLVINELIGNALKHAFKHQESGQISVSLLEKGKVLELQVKDNGTGISDLESIKHQSFGYSLVQSFAKKLNADLHITSHHGLTVTLIIKSYLKAGVAA